MRLDGSTTSMLIREVNVGTVQVLQRLHESPNALQAIRAVWMAKVSLQYTTESACMSSAPVSVQQSWQNALISRHGIANAACLTIMLWQVCISVTQNKDAPQEEFDSKLADLKKELGYWESYLGANEYLAGSQFSLAGEGLSCVCLSPTPHCKTT